jgi:hypothetical protein
MKVEAAPGMALALDVYGQAGGHEQVRRGQFGSHYCRRREFGCSQPTSLASVRLLVSSCHCICGGLACSDLAAFHEDVDKASQHGQQGCHKGRFWRKITVRTSFSSGRPRASAFTPRTGFYRPPTQ